MKKASRFLTLGFTGLGITAAIGILALDGTKIDLFIYMIPWLVFIIIGIGKRKKVSESE